MQLGTWTKLGTGQPHYPTNGRPGLNGDVKDPNNPIEYSELFIAPVLPQLTSRETNWCAQQFSEKNI
jgi:hypothetical protein